MRCGAGESMTQADLDAGVVVLHWGMATARPAEFDIHTLRLQARRAGQLTPEPLPEERSRQPLGAEQRPVLEVDLGRVVSRYIGETEKNLRRLFDRAEESGQVLLFDEADAVFGKRTEVRDAQGSSAEPQVSDVVETLARERGVPVRWRRRPRRPRT